MAVKVGVDIGSRNTKVAVLDDEVTYSIFDSSEMIYSGLDLGIPKGSSVVTTGYGRHRIEGAVSIPEIRAHTLGVMNTLDLRDFTLLDIGGQDFKITRVEKGGIRDFNMNDKCAAGTGRFLEKMSEVLSLSIEELGGYRGTRKVLESTCSVFTESEIIGMMMEDVPREEICSGVIFSVFERVRPYIRRYPLDTIVFTGGVSRSEGLRRTLEDELEVDIVVPDNAQFMGALGCSISRKHKTM